MSVGSAEAEPIAAAAEALYGVPLSAFTGERKRLADQLKAAESKAFAAIVARLPRPTMSAWVVNQLWRMARPDLDALLAAGARVRDGDRGGLDEQRAALGRLRTRAAAVLAADGHAASPATIQRVATTLQALSALGTWEPDRPGRMIADRDPPGFDVMLGALLDGPEGPTPIATPIATPPPIAGPRIAPTPIACPPFAVVVEPAPIDELAARRATDDRATVEKVAHERAARARVRAAERALHDRAVEGMGRAVVQRTAELANARAEVEVAEAALARAQTHVRTATDALATAEQRAADADAARAEHDRADRS